jgi:hypothetical protein
MSWSAPIPPLPVSVWAHAAPANRYAIYAASCPRGVLLPDLPWEAGG